MMCTCIPCKPRVSNYNAQSALILEQETSGHSNLIHVFNKYKLSADITIK